MFTKRTVDILDQSEICRNYADLDVVNSIIPFCVLGLNSSLKRHFFKFKNNKELEMLSELDEISPHTLSALIFD